MQPTLNQLDPRTARLLPWIVAIAFFMQTLDGTILNTALPAMAGDLNEDPLRMQSVVIAYMLTVALLAGLAIGLVQALTSVQESTLTFVPKVGAMLVGAVVRNIDDRTRLIGLSVPTTELIGNVCLSLFLAVALMNLKLWELAGLALPLLVNLGLQALLVTAFCAVVFRTDAGRMPI